MASVTDTIQPLTFQEAAFRLQQFWAEQGCVILQPINTEVGAGTMNPATFLRVLGDKPWSTAYIEPSVRPDDSRYGDNPNRVQTHTQFQVILKPDTGHPIEQYLSSLKALGIDIASNDIRFVEDNWESPALGAWGLGWEVWLNGLEITQFTYFQQAGGFTLDPVSVEITYGLERILMALQRRSHFKEIEYAANVTYDEVFGRSEYEMSVYYLDAADVEVTRSLFDGHEHEALAMLERGLVVPAYRHLLALSHLFNVLDARGAVGIAERAGFFARMRRLSRGCAELWLSSGGSEAETPPAVAARPSEVVEPVPAREPQTFVLEVGTEELPPGDVDIALDVLRREVPQMLAGLILGHGQVTVHATPRRIVVTVLDLVSGQEDRQDAISGPRANVAFDANGNPTKAAAGFAARHGLTPLDLTRITDNGQEYVVANVEHRGRATVSVLADELAGLLEKVTFPRSMRWNASGAAFSRPVRWLLALLGADVVPFTFAGVTSGRTTRGLRGRDQTPIDVADAAAHATSMAKLGITLDRTGRREKIWSGAVALVAEIGGEVPAEYRGGLLAEVADLVEVPTLISAQFEERFLSLPPEVLRTVMVKHQRFFPIVRDGRLSSGFIGVANGDVSRDAVREGYEAVIRARYSDAEFFYQQDLARDFESFRDELHTLTFHERLGSMRDKASRLETLTRWLAAEAQLRASDVDAAERAARLAKYDLVTQMVTEFSGLAGTMGRYYAAHAGAPAPVAAAIRDHVRPASAADDPPEGLPGAVIGAADRIDSLVGLFSVGVQPRSNADPYALRRAAYGLVQIVLRHDLDIDLERVIGAAADGQPVDVTPEARQDVGDFIWRRLEVLLRDRGLPHDVVAAAVGGTRPSIAAKHRVALELGEIASSDELSAVLAAYNRAARIAKDTAADMTVDPSLFETEYEARLWETYVDVAADPDVSLSIEGFVRAFGPLVDAIDDLFENVLVMSEDPATAQNRLAMLARIAALPRPLADLTRLQTVTDAATRDPR